MIVEFVLPFMMLRACLGENYKTDGYVITPKTMQLLEEHLKAIDGRVEFHFLVIFHWNYDIMLIIKHMFRLVPRYLEHYINHNQTSR